MPRGSTAKEIGNRQKEKILALLVARPMSARELAAQVHLTVCGVLIHTKQMMRETPRRVRIAGYETTSGKPTPLYGPGAEADAVYSVLKPRKPKQPDRVEMRLAQLVALLEIGSYTAEQIGQHLSMSHSRARTYVSRLRAMRWAYISDWLAPEGRGDLAPVYALGMKADKPKPRQTRAQRYLKEKRDPDRYQRILAQRRHLYLRDKLKQKPNGIFGALGI